MPFQRYAVALKQVEERLGHERAVKAWERYLRNTEPIYASAQRFSQTINQWVVLSEKRESIPDDKEWK